MSADVVLVSLGSTQGLRTADRALAGALERAGARVELVQAQAPKEVRTLALTDLLWAIAARRAAAGAILDNHGAALLYSTTTAALLWPAPGAIRFDAPAAANRPGRHGVWQRPLERARLREAPVLVPQSEAAMAEVPARARARARAVVVPVTIDTPVAPPPTDMPAAGRDIDAITYGANPMKKGLDRVLEAWQRARREGERLVVAGAAIKELVAAGCAVEAEGVEVVGALNGEEYRALLARSRVFVCAPRREDHGLAQMEALAHGCMLVTTPAPGPYLALDIARGLDERLVGEDLAGALRAALDQPKAGYDVEAARALVPYSQAVVDQVVAIELLPRLMALRSEAP